MANNIYGFIALTGGGTGALDKIDGSALADGDMAYGLYFKYRLNATSAAAEAVPSIISPDTNAGDKRWILVGFSELINNLKPVVNADVNKLDVFAKSSGAAPSSSNTIHIAIPDANGNTPRFRSAAVASGTGQIIMADAANYWSKGSLDAEIKTAWLYAIWSAADSGIVWALGGYSGFTVVPTTTTATDDDYLLLEASSTYTRQATDYCVAVAKIRYQYDTADTPDHTIQASGENAPQVLWNLKSDYGYQKNLATTNTSGSNITEYSAVSVVVKQSRKYLIINCATTTTSDTYNISNLYVKTGSATYGSALTKGYAGCRVPIVPSDYARVPLCAKAIVYLNAGDTIHLGVEVTAVGGNRVLLGDDTIVGATSLSFQAID